MDVKYANDAVTLETMITVTRDVSKNYDVMSKVATMRRMTIKEWQLRWHQGNEDDGVIMIAQTNCDSDDGSHDNNNKDESDVDEDIDQPLKTIMKSMMF